MESAYSVDNAYKFAWSSVTGNLNQERVSHLTKHLFGKRVLDVGCSGGAYVDYLTRNGFQVTGVEKFDHFIKLARESGRQGTFLEADITCLPFRDQAFDSTYCFDVLEHVDDRVALAELARVTSKRLILTVPRENDAICKFNLTFLHYSDKTHLRNYTEDSLREILSQINYLNLRIFPELPVFVKNFTREMVDFRVKSIMPLELKYRMLKRIIREIFQLRRPNIDLLYHEVSSRLLNTLFDNASYKDIRTGLVAIVDLT